MIADANRRLMSPAEYLDWEPQQPYKSEYLHGEVYAMTGGTLRHNAIALNLASALKAHLRGTGCRVFINDVMVQADPHSAYFYPDIVVTCDPRDVKAQRIVQHPCLIIEVLSPGTEGYDRGEKFKHYRNIASLKEYGLINADSLGVECHRLNAQGKWELTPYFPEDMATFAPVEFASVGFSCSFDVIYEAVEWGQSEAESG